MFKCSTNWKNDNGQEFCITFPLGWIYLYDLDWLQYLNTITVGLIKTFHRLDDHMLINGNVSIVSIASSAPLQFATSIDNTFAWGTFSSTMPAKPTICNHPSAGTLENADNPLGTSENLMSWIAQNAFASTLPWPSTAQHCARGGTTKHAHANCKLQVQYHQRINKSENESR